MKDIFGIDQLAILAYAPACPAGRLTGLIDLFIGMQWRCHCLIAYAPSGQLSPKQKLLYLT